MEPKNIYCLLLAREHAGRRHNPHILGVETENKLEEKRIDHSLSPAIMGTTLSKTVAISCLVIADGASSNRQWIQARPAFFKKNLLTKESPALSFRGGESATKDVAAAAEPSLDDKVDAAMKKSGLSLATPEEGDDEGCKDGICPMPSSPTPSTTTELDPNEAALSSRGGESATKDVAATAEPSLDDKVNAAMKKLGLSPASPEESDDGACKDGVCPMPSSPSPPTTELDPNELAAKIAEEMKVDSQLAMAAIGATSTFGEKNERTFNEKAARELIQQELDLIDSIPEDSQDVQQLIKEGFDPFLSRRALAFAERNMDDARAILIADKMDQEEEEKAANAALQEEDEEVAMRAQLRAEQASKQPDLVEIKTNFDPTALPATPKPQKQPEAQPNSIPKPATKESVVFEATTAQLQELVLESPVPVLLDVYAEWCGPCKVLGPALEEMAVKAGGAFRLVKVNSDNERPVSGALEVTALPTVFGIRDGKIVHMFQGMPRSEKMMQNFMMGLFGAAKFDPPVTAEESKKYDELTAKLIKTAGAACFSFSARERLTERITSKLDTLVKDESVKDVESAASLLRTLVNNVVRNPYDQKYRKINLENKVIASRISGNASCLAILKSVGFAKAGSEMILAKGKKVVNVAPLVCARDCIEKWIQKNRAEMAALARKRKDEVDRARLQAEREAAGDDDDDIEAEEEEFDPTACKLKLRLDGKKKVQDVVLHEDDTLRSVLDVLNIDAGEQVQITCVAKRLVVKSSDEQAMQKTLRDHGLMPAAVVVVKVGEGTKSVTSSLKERAAEKKSRKKGSHTMQSIGIYAKDDNNKAELIDGGGGVWYEHDVSDDEGKSDDEEGTANAEENLEDDVEANVSDEKEK